MPTVGAIMSGDLLTVAAESSLREAARAMNDRRVGAVVVLDGRRLVGILTERDVLRAVATERLESAVRDVMTHAPDTIESDDTTGHAASLMIHGGFRHLPVVDGDDVVGIVSIRDLMRVQLDDESPRGA
jgi:CBS domain-containing protein